METVTLNVSGMMCGGCSSTIKEKLEASAGVSSANADHAGNKVEIEFDPAITNLDRLKKVITEASYTVE